MSVLLDGGGWRESNSEGLSVVKAPYIWRTRNRIFGGCCVLGCLPWPADAKLADMDKFINHLTPAA